MAAAEASTDPELPSLGSCIAGLRTALTDAEGAVERWCDDELDPMAARLADATAAFARARRMADAVRLVVPGHSRRARLVRRAVEQVEEALRLAERARAWDWSAEDPEADAAMEAALRRALATAEHAVDSAVGQPPSPSRSSQ
jgi:hypothetical protein